MRSLLPGGQSSDGHGDIPFFGYPIYAEIAFHLEVKGRDKFTTTIVGGSFGLLAVDPRIMPVRRG